LPSRWNSLDARFRSSETHWDPGLGNITRWLATPQWELDRPLFLYASTARPKSPCITSAALLDALTSTEAEAEAEEMLVDAVRLANQLVARHWQMHRRSRLRIVRAAEFRPEPDRGHTVPARA